MSKLIDRLKQITRDTHQPIGFRAGQSTASKRPMLLITSLTHPAAASQDSYLTDADAVLLNSPKLGKGAKGIRQFTDSLGDTTWGIKQGDITQKETTKIVDAGCDFLVFPTDSAIVTTTQDENTGKILQIESSLGEGLLRAVNDLPVDAVLAVDSAENSLTWHHLLLFQRFTNLLNKPLLVSIPLNSTAVELQSLQEAGVVGIVVTIEPDSSTEKWEELRQAIDNLASLPPRKRGNIDALVPLPGSQASTVTDTEEEEYEEEEL
ncbi:hypothetical protein ACFLXD_06760 [Chloroflexota bacterium]